MVRSSTARTAVTYIGERVVTLAITALTGIVVARHLGPTDLGVLSFAAGVFGLAVPFAWFGMDAILAREFVVGHDPGGVLRRALATQLPAAVVACVVATGVAFIGLDADRPAGFLLLLALLPLPFLSLSQDLRVFAEAVGASRTVLWSSLIGAVFGAALRLGGVLVDAPLWLYAAALSAQAGLTLGGLVFLTGLRPRITSIRRRDFAEGAQLRREAAPLLLGTVGVAIYMRSDMTMLGIFSSGEETGIYAAVARLSEVWYFLPAAALAAVRPGLSRRFRSGDQLSYESHTQRFLAISALGGATCTAVVVVLAPQIVHLSYGEQYSAAISVLRVHVLAAPFVFLGVAASQWFIDRGLTRHVMIRSWGGAGLNILLNVLLIPRMGALGASLATVVSYAAASVLFNSLSVATRPLFWMQLRALSPAGLRWVARIEPKDTHPAQGPPSPLTEQGTDEKATPERQDTVPDEVT